MAKAPKNNAAPKTDKAKRPSPPDRDGDGASGGSLPGNHTDPHALGSADDVIQHDLATAQIAEDGTATIIIAAATEGNRARPSVGVNGKQRHLDVGVEVQVNADELAVLESSHVDYTVVVPLAPAAADEAAGVEGSSSAAEAPAETDTPEDDTGGGAGTQSEGESATA